MIVEKSTKFVELPQHIQDEYNKIIETLKSQDYWDHVKKYQNGVTTDKDIDGWHNYFKDNEYKTVSFTDSRTMGFISQVFFRISDDFIDCFKDYLNWYKLTILYRFEEFQLAKYQDKINWKMIKLNKQMSESRLQNPKIKLLFGKYLCK